MKGADVVMQNYVNYNDWLEEEVKIYCAKSIIASFMGKFLNFWLTLACF